MGSINIFKPLSTFLWAVPLIYLNNINNSFCWIFWECWESNTFSWTIHNFGLGNLNHEQMVRPGPVQNIEKTLRNKDLLFLCTIETEKRFNKNIKLIKTKCLNSTWLDYGTATSKEILNTLWHTKTQNYCIGELLLGSDAAVRNAHLFFTRTTYSHDKQTHEEQYMEVLYSWLPHSEIASQLVACH